MAAELYKVFQEREIAKLEIIANHYRMRQRETFYLFSGIDKGSFLLEANEGLAGEKFA